MGTYEISKTPKGAFKWNLKAGNGEIVLSSQMYKSKASAQKGIASVAKNSAHDDRFERKIARNKKPFFVAMPTGPACFPGSNSLPLVCAHEVSVQECLADGDFSTCPRCASASSLGPRSGALRRTTRTARPAQCPTLTV